MEKCESCGRKLTLTEHHLIPKEMHNKKWCRNLFTIKEMNTMKAIVCQDCHASFHHFLSNKDLAKTYNSIEKLLKHPKILKFVKWVSKSNNRKFKY